VEAINFHLRIGYHKCMAYLEDILSDSEFQKRRDELVRNIQNDENVYSKFMEIFVELMKYEYVSSKNWQGIPIVKLPEDVMVIQEFHYDYKPTAVIEVGVARGGSVALAASMQQLNGLKPNILGIDIKIFDHARKALSEYIAKGWLELLEQDSTSAASVEKIRQFVSGHKRVFAILDSNHSHEHVSNELNVMNSCLPVGSAVLVADGIIEHLPSRSDRPWGKGNSPATAVNQFLKENANWRRLEKYSRRSIFSEFRDGWIEKTGE
jgi:cephalosporin hydroxylase